MSETEEEYVRVPRRLFEELMKALHEARLALEGKG
jgi:hypothetical protein